MKIDNDLIASFNQCDDRHENYLKYYKDTSFTWLEFLNLDKITTNDKLWVFVQKIHGIEKIQREFALLCAERAVQKVNIPEINEYFTLVCFIVESDMWELKNTEGYRAAYRAADRAADRAAERTAYWMAERAAYRAAYWAACLAAYSAEYRAAYWAAEREIQLEILKYLFSE